MQHLVHRQRPRVRQPRAHAAIERLELREHALGGDEALRRAGVAVDVEAHVELAARDAGGDRLAQRRLAGAQLVGQPELRIEVARVDAADLEHDRADAVVAAGEGEAGHAGDGHGAGRRVAGRVGTRRDAI